MKANANMKKQVKHAIPVAAQVYEKQLHEEVNADREEHSKKPFDDDPPNAPVKEREIVTSSLPRKQAVPKTGRASHMARFRRAGRRDSAHAIG